MSVPPSVLSTFPGRLPTPTELPGKLGPHRDERSTPMASAPGQAPHPDSPHSGPIQPGPPLPDRQHGGQGRTTPAVFTRELGARGERIAADYLASRGFALIARNWHCRYGELDLVMRDGAAFVAVEVKTRSGTGYGDPLESITARKAARLRRVLLEWGSTTGHRGARLRVDAVGITLRPGEASPRIQHLRAVA